MKKQIRKTVSVLLTAAMAAGTLALLPAQGAVAGGLGTYECETFEGVDQVWTSIYKNETPGYSGEGFAYLTAAPISVDIEIEEEGMYQIDVRAIQILSKDEGKQLSRMQTISINGIDYTYQMPYTETWQDMTFGVFRMKAGVNTITLKPQYGYGAYDTMTISKAELPEVKGAASLVDAKATPETKALYSYLASEYGKHILSGQQEIYGGGHGVQTDIRYDAENDKCVDGAGKEYTIDKDSYDTDEQGNKFPWHCMDETGFVYTYSTQNRNYTYNDYEQECRYLYELTGDYPAIRGFDLNCHNPGFAWEDGVTDRMIDWAKNRNGIVTISWHCTVPKQMYDVYQKDENGEIVKDASGNPVIVTPAQFDIDEDGNITKISNDWQAYTYSESTDFKPSNVMIEGTKENVFYNEAIKLAAAELLRLQEAGVPVIFRPLHEAEGNPAPEGKVSGSWFWWGREGAEVYNELWKYLFDKLTNEYGIHNLIWEQNLYAWSEESARWYTGDDYVDMVGFDKYNTVYNRHDGGETNTPNEDAESKIFWQLVDFVDNDKIVSMPENSTIPSISNLQIEQAKWSYFCTWYDDGDKFISGENYQNAETVKEMFQSDYCITLSELPKDLYGSAGEKPTEQTTEKTTDTPTEQPSEGASTLCGDVDENGKVNVIDVITLNKAFMVGEKLTEQGRINAVTTAAARSKNADPTPTDALNILKRVVGLIPELPIKD